MKNITLAVIIALFASFQIAYGGEQDMNRVLANPGNWSLNVGGVMGQISTAEAVPSGAIDLGAYVGAYEDANTIFGRFAVGIMSNADFEVKSGILDSEGGDDPNFMIGAGIKYHFYNRVAGAMPDMALNWVAEIYDIGEDATLWLAGMGLVASYPIRLKNNSDISPYGRLQLRIEGVSVGDYDKSDFDIGLNLGGQYKPGDRLQFYLEFQFDDQVGLIAGINFAVY